MDLDAFASSPVGVLVPVRGYEPRFGESFEHQAFLPEALPPSLHLEQETHRAIRDATAAIARLDQAAARLPNPSLLARPAIRREAVSTSALEGTYAAFTDVLEADLLGDEGTPATPVTEVVNYVRAADLAHEQVQERGITVGLLEELHHVLVRGTRGHSSDAGRVRTIQVCIGGSGHVEDARFVPPPPGDQLRAGLDAWEQWINAEDDHPAVVKMALGHYQFETLHPFNDGNGRIGRLVCVLQSASSQELSVPVLDLSPWLEKHREEYQQHLLQCSLTGEFDSWLRFFSEAIRFQALAAVHRIEALLRWKDGVVEQLRAERVRGVAIIIAEELIGFPMITPTMSAQRHGVTYPTANNAIGRLESLGILQERTGRRYARIFGAPDVLRIVES